MNQNETPPTIAELWGELKKEESKAAKHWTTYERTKSDSALIWHTKSRAKVNSLRSRLLERCKDVRDADETSNVHTHFSVMWLPSGSIARSEVRGANVRYDNADSLGNLSAAYAFWAWELSQRQKEGKP